MKEIAVLSGKGGTGKTSIVASLAVLSESKVLADCSVDAPGLHLLLQPEVQEKHELWSGQVAFIDEEKCTQCGRCERVCHFSNITDVISNCLISAISCEGCRFCSNVCPEEAITMKENLSGTVFFSSTRYGPLVHAVLEITQENSGKLVSLVRLKAKQIAGKEGLKWIISDGPAGTGNPAISSLVEADMALLVTEPTLSGIQDLERIHGVCRRFSVPAVVCINKYDINEDNTRRIEGFCLDQGIELVSKIPYDDGVLRASAGGFPAAERGDNTFSRQIRALWEFFANKL